MDGKVAIRLRISPLRLPALYIATSADSLITPAQFELVDRATRVRHPESNGRLEHCHRSIREEGLAYAELSDLYQARINTIAAWVGYYNNKSFHAGLQYLRPVC
jgi:hypothetical protein